MGATEFFIGVDGGGTGCRAALSRAGGAGRVEAAGGPSNVTSDFDGALATIRSLIDGLLERAGTQAASGPASVHLGLAGVTGAAMAARVEAALSAALPGHRVRATGDQVTMLAGALGPRGDGCVVGIGTGSFVARRAGQQVRSLGGRGLILGDQASGAWFGLRLLQDVTLMLDGLAPPTPLSRTVAERYGGEPARLIAFARGASPADFATFAPELIAAGRADDPLALRLLHEGCAYIAAGLAALGWRPGETVCLTGGLGPALEPWLAPDIRAALAPPRGTALDGALMLAQAEAP